MAQKQRITIALQVNIRPEVFDRLTENFQGGVSPADALGGMCSVFLEKMSDGGVMLSPDEVSTIQKNYGKIIGSARDVVRATESQKNLEEGMGTYKFSIDPSFLPPLEQLSKEIGRPLNELMGDFIDMAIGNNWLYSIVYEGKRRTFSPDAEDKLAKKIGKQDFSIEDIMEYIRLLEKTARKAEQEAVA